MTPGRRAAAECTRGVMEETHQARELLPTPQPEDGSRWGSERLSALWRRGALPKGLASGAGALSLFDTAVHLRDALRER